MTQERKAVVVLGVFGVLIVALSVLITLFFREEQSCMEKAEAKVETKMLSVVPIPDNKNINKQTTLDKLEQTAVSYVISGKADMPSAKQRSESNLAEEMFKVMDDFDNVLTTSLQKADRATVDELARYRLAVRDRNRKEFDRAYARTVLYVQNGGAWVDGWLIVSYRPNGSANWKKIDQFEIE